MKTGLCEIASITNESTIYILKIRKKITFEVICLRFALGMYFYKKKASGFMITLKPYKTY